MESCNKIIVIGAGNSAARFIHLFKKRGCQIGVFMHRKDLVVPKGCVPVHNLDAIERYDAGVVSSSTSSHLYYVRKFVAAGLPILVDKPFSNNMRGVSQIVRIAKQKNIFIYVGFNLRFLPILAKLNADIKKGKLGKILSIDISVGQHLPQWRINRDYKKTYSSSYVMGGGVALDLIHDIDVALSFLPDTDLRVVYSNKLSSLDIDVEDIAVFQRKSMPYMHVRLDYLNHMKTRRYTIIGELGSVECDIANKRYIFTDNKGNGEVHENENDFDVQSTYGKEVDHFLSLLHTKQIENWSDRALGIDALRICLKARKNVQK